MEILKSKSYKQRKRFYLTNLNQSGTIIDDIEEGSRDV